MEDTINKAEQSLKMQLLQLKDALRSALNELEAIDILCSAHGIPSRRIVEGGKPGIKSLLKTHARVKILIKKLEERTR